jgi:hypothetical protein
MPKRVAAGVKVWDGSKWYPYVPWSNKAGIGTVNRIWYSQDSIGWQPLDLADEAQTPPSVPNTCTATANSSSQITVNWTAPTSPNDMVGYELRYGVGSSLADGAGTPIYTGSGLSKVHTGLSGSTQYAYNVRGFTGDNQFGPGKKATATTPAAYTDYYAEFGLAGGCGAWTGSAWESQSGAGRVRQSNSSGNNYDGYWFYGQTLKDNINGSTILNADFRITRQASGSGPSGNVSVQLGVHKHTTKPGTPDSASGLYNSIAVARGANFWIHGGSGGSTMKGYAEHIAGDINGAWRGIKCGDVGLSVDLTYVSAGSSATDPANDPGGNFRVWWRRYG